METGNKANALNEIKDEYELKERALSYDLYNKYLGLLSTNDTTYKDIFTEFSLPAAACQKRLEELITEHNI